MAFATMLLLGTTSLLHAQIVSAPGSGARVLQTQNGIVQVDIARASNGGVSVNQFKQFDVTKSGAILNNSPVVTSTQLAGYISGNSNLSPGNAAKVIVNQVLSNAASQLSGPIEIAGQRAELVIANGNGLVVNGVSFLNASRAILTTGTPNYGANGALTGFNVTGGSITVQGAGLDARGVDAVDLLARAIQVNAAIYANRLNAITGANQIDHDTLAATPIAGDGPAPALAIDVSALGGMYSNRIYLASNEYGVGVSTRGLLAAQAGDLTLQVNVKLVLAGTQNASGNINASAAQGIDNSGTTYAKGAVNASTAGALTNDGLLASQHDTTVNAGSVASNGTLGAGVNEDGSIAQSGDLSVGANGAVSANGRNEAGGNATISGASVNLAGSNTSANGAVTLAATGANATGDLNLSGATTTAGGALNARATGTLTNDRGNASGRAVKLTAGALSNVNGQFVSGSTLDSQINGALNNRGGTMQAAGRETIHAGSMDNTAGRVVSLNGDGLSIATDGALTNGAGGAIGTNGALDVNAGTLANHSTMTALGDATVHAQSIDNSGGSVTAGGALTTATPGALNNVNGTLSGGTTTTVSGASIDSTNGDIEGDALSVSTPGALINRGGKLIQYGANDQSIVAGGAFDSTGGTIASNARNLSVDANGFTNDSGKFQHAGTGALTINSKGALSNASGQIVTNGALALQAALALNNSQGVIQAARDAAVGGASINNNRGNIEADALAVSATGDLLNYGGALTQYGTSDQTIHAGGTLDNSNGGTIASNARNLSIDANGITNDSGKLQHAGTGTLTIDSTGALSNASGKIVTNGALALQAALALNNAQGTIQAARAATVSASSLNNSKGDIEADALAVSTSGDLLNQGGALTQYGTGDQTIHAGGTLDNSSGGTIASNARNLSIDGATIVNDAGKVQHAGTGLLALIAARVLSNVGGSVQTNGALDASASSIDNASGTLLAMQIAQINATQSLLNRGGSLYGGRGLSVTTQGDIDNTGGSAQTAGDLTLNAGGALLNGQGTVNANGAHSAVNVNAARIDNTAGKLTNAGDGSTILNASDIKNTSGILGGNGDVTLNGDTLENDAGANLVAGGAANLNLAQRIDNEAGTLFGGTALNVGQSTTTVINDHGAMLGALDVTANVAALSNDGGSIRSNRDTDVSGAISGDGEMNAGRNLGLSVEGDYTNSAANKLHADGDMNLSATGTLTNDGTLDAGGALTASGRDVINTAGADINSTNTTVTASNSISNDGRIEGDSVTTNAVALTNTATIIGNEVTLNGTDLKNSGAAAAIASADGLKVYMSNSVTNEEGALLYSGGNMEIAKDGTRDEYGFLANQTNTLINSASSIESDGDLDIAAHDVQNLRTGAQTAAGTPQDEGSTTLTLWTAGLSGSELGGYHSFDFPGWDWGAGAIGAETIGHLSQPITVTVPKDQVANLDASAQTFSLTAPLSDNYWVFAVNPKTGMPGMDGRTRVITNNATQWYNGLVDNGDGTVSITFWPDFDPNKQMRPDTVKVDSSLGSDNHDYVEMSRTTHTTTTTDQLIDAGTGATMQAQGAMRINADGGSIRNESSTMAAGGDLTRRATGGIVDDTGVVLQQSIVMNSTSDWYWHQKSGGDSDTKNDIPNNDLAQTTSTVDALPAIYSSNANLETHAATISINSVDRTGATVIGSGVTGGSADGTQTGAISGQGSAAPAVSGQGSAAQAVSGQSSAPQTLGGATGGIPNLKLPVNGLYTYNTAPGASYLIATDPRLTSYTKFISSDYMLNALDIDPQKTIKRLGDGVYEQTLIRNQVTQLTGRTFLNGFSDAMAEYTALMNNGVAYAKQFDISVGIALTPEQMGQLTNDMVWLVSQDVTLPDGSHQTVLVPTVYLARANTVDLTHSGVLVTGNTVTQNATGDFTSSGHVTSNLATTIIGNNIVNSGVVGSGGTTALVAVQDVRNVSGRIGGNDVLVQAGRDVINETQTYGISRDFTSAGVTGQVTGTGVDAIGTISATHNAQVNAGRDVNLSGATIVTGNDAGVLAGRDINAGTTSISNTRDVHSFDGQNGSRDAVTQQLGSAITAGGDVSTLSGRDTTLTGSALKAGGDVTALAGRDMTVTASKDTASHSEQSMGGPNAQHTGSSYDERVNGSAIGAGGNSTLAAGQGGAGSLAVMGSSVTTDTGGVKLLSTGDITLGSVSETHDSQNWSHQTSSGALSKTETTDTASSHQVFAQGATISGETVTGNAGHDMTISGSTVAATNDVALSAGHNLIVGTSTETNQSSSFHEEKKSGFGTAGAGISYGTNDQKDTYNDAGTTEKSSLIGSTSGNVSMKAGDTLHVTGSDIVAAGNVSGTGADVIIDAAQNATHHDETHETHSSGFTLAMKSSVIDAIQTAGQQARAADSGSGDSRTDTLHALASAGSIINGATPLASGQAPDWKVELSFGASSSKSTSSDDSVANRGSNVMAGGTSSFVAKGDGSAGSGNVTIAGSDINAKNVVLAAANQVNLVNSTDTDSSRSESKSSSGSIGVSYGTSGFGASVSGSKAHANANADSTAQTNTHVKGSDGVTIVSGGDTNIKGATVDGGQVTALIGGDLNIASVQDTSHSAAHQDSTSAGLSISQAGGSGSFSNQHGDAHGDYAGVEEQSGLHAGAGGFDINVKGNTDLKGAYISSDADASKNTLTTGTLSFSDITNNSNYSASSSGFSAGGSMGAPNSAKANGVTSLSNGGGVSPMISQHDSGNETATTKSAIAAGSINVTDKDHQAQDIASLNRDTTDLNGTVSKLPDLAGLLDKQASTQQAAAIVAQTVSTQIGAYAERQKAAALAAGDQATADKWSEGGEYRIAMHIAGGAAVAGLGGGNVAGGAAGAGISAAAAGKLNELSHDIAASSPTGNADADKALGQIISNVVAAGAGAAVGVSSGAMTAANADMFNRQLHPEENKWIKDNAARYAKEQGISVDQAVAALTAQADRQVQNGSAGAWDQSASAFLGQAHGMLPADGNSGPGYMFYATPDQKANAGMYAGYYPNGVGPNQPSVKYIANSANRDAANRNAMSNETMAAAAAAGLIAGGPAIAALTPPLADILASYKAGQAAYSLNTAALTGGITSGSIYTGIATGSALYDSFRGSDFGTSFNERFSVAGLAAATTVGALNAMFGASMYKWAEVPNNLSNILTVPGAVIRINGLATGQAAGKAAQGAVKDHNQKK